ncbi:MAG: hypothetical protein SVW77_03825, partial [Candidatus Nanohaloarchaea archaeon]|nr:hypothetical protein [Candidatus Nanohaloarchaea archaeon]
EHDTGSSFRSSLSLSVPDLTLKQLAVLGGVALMSTLFLGTVFFASSIGPSSPRSGGTTAREPSPPVGYTVQSQADIPKVRQERLPQGAVVDHQLDEDVQLFLLAQPAVLLQYSCTDCPGTV